MIGDNEGDVWWHRPVNNRVQWNWSSLKLYVEWPWIPYPQGDRSLVDVIVIWWQLILGSTNRPLPSVLSSNSEEDKAIDQLYSSSNRLYGLTNLGADFFPGVNTCPCGQSYQQGHLDICLCIPGLSKNRFFKKWRKEPKMPALPKAKGAFSWREKKNASRVCKREGGRRGWREEKERSHGLQRCVHQPLWFQLSFC